MAIDWSNPTVQAAALGLAGVVIVALVGLGGAIAGARISADSARRAAEIQRRQARDDREATQRWQLTEKLREVATDLLVRSERHRHEIWVQQRAWSRVARGVDKPDSIPAVGSIDDVLDSARGRPRTSSRAPHRIVLDSVRGSLPAA